MDVLYDLFEVATTRHSMNTAIVWKDANFSYLTYERLRFHAHEIAEYLDGTYAERGFVGILIERIPPLCCVVLGILKRGLAFAFIDDKSPYEWNKNLLEKLSISWIVSVSDQLQTELLQKHGTLAKCLDVCGSRIELWNVTFETSSSKNDTHTNASYAYAVQTSGTTGTPKIVKVPHKCLIPNILDFGRILSVSASDVVLLGTSLTFDPCLVELFLALANGATLAMPSAYEVATVVQTTPSLLTAKYKWECMVKLRCLVLGGEPCPSPSVVSHHLRLLPSRPKVFSAYGITEVSCWATLQEVDLDAEEAVAVPLGGALSETLLEVRDGKGNVLTVGEGHLYIGSGCRVCVIDDERERDLPAIVFRPTGDIVKVCPKGLWFVSRKDKVAKRWGRRIDLQHVENTAARLTNGLTCCAVLVDSLLILAVSGSVDSHKLRQELVGFLPLDHTPDAVVELKNFPLTRHGKVDLPSVHSYVVSSIQSAGGIGIKDIYDTLKKLWRELLNREPSSGSFLEEGGSSIIALQLCSMLELQLFRQLPSALLPALLSGSGATFAECLHILESEDVSCASRKLLLANQLQMNITSLHSPSLNTGISVGKEENSHLASSENLTVASTSTDVEEIQELKEIAAAKYVTHVEDQKLERNEVTQKSSGKIPVHIFDISSELGQTLEDSVSDGLCINSKRELCGSKTMDLEKENLFINYEEKKHMNRKNRHLSETLSTIFGRSGGNKILWCSRNCSFGCDKDCVLSLHYQGNIVKYSVTEQCPYQWNISSSVKLKLLWKLYLNQCVDASPCMALYSSMHWLALVGSHSGQLAIIHDDGKVHSIVQLMSRIEAPVCVSPCGQRAFVGCYDGNVYCIDITNDSIVWISSVGGKVKGAPVVCCNKTALVVGCYNKKLHCIKLQDGAPVWSCEVGVGSICASPCVDSRAGLIFTGTLDGTIAAVQEASGQILWQHRLATAVFSSPVSLLQSERAVVIVAEVLGNVHCFAATNGDELWRFQAAGNIFSSLCLIDLALNFKDNENNVTKCILFGCHDHKVYCLNIQGHLLWTAVLSSPVYATPFAFSTEDKTLNLVAAATTSGTVCILNAKSGKLLCSENLGCDVFSSPSVCNGMLLIGARDNYLYAFKLIEHKKESMTLEPVPNK